MTKSILKYGLIAAFVIAFLATEGALISMATSAVARLSKSTPSDLFNENRMHRLVVRDEFSLLAAGDIGSCGVRGGLNRLNHNLRYAFGLERPEINPIDGMQTTTAILAAHPDVPVLALGDLAYKRGEPVSFADCYDPFWGQAKDRTWPAPGNHEYQSLNAYGYFDYWGERAGPDRAGYYALEAGDWLILSLNSEIDASDGSAQETWLRTILAKNSETCVGAYFHRPAYSTVERNGTENAKLLFAKLADAGAVFVLNGHNHFFEQTKPLDANGLPADVGVTTFVSGAGGKVTEQALSAGEISVDLVTGTAGLMKLDFEGRQVAWSFVTDITGSSRSRDTLICE